MNLIVQALEGVGDIARERVVLKALADLDLTDYAIVACSFGANGQPNAGNFSAGYWFGTKKVSKGDLVVVYTKVGRRSEKKTDRITSHFLYWHRTQLVWTGDKKPVLLYAPDWDYITDDVATIEPEAAPKKE